MRFRKLSPEKIEVATAYQRIRDRRLEAEIAAHYEEDAFGVIVAGEREDGSYWCVDGQTRLAAAIKLCLKEVPCIVFASRGKEHEAQLFRLLNEQRNMGKLDKLNALVVEGDAKTVDMINIIRQSGFDIGFKGNKQWPYIRSVVPIERAYEDGILDRVLKIVMDAWGASEDVHALQVPMLGGLRKFLKAHGNIIDDKELSERLSSYVVTQLVARCEARKMQGGSREAAVYDVIVDVWNHRRRNKIYVAKSMIE